MASAVLLQQIAQRPVNPRADHREQTIPNITRWAGRTSASQGLKRNRMLVVVKRKEESESHVAKG